MALKNAEEQSAAPNQAPKTLKRITQVVRELPTQPVRSMQTQIDGEDVVVNFMTVEEALQELLDARAE